jgi:hypothetical protein
MAFLSASILRKENCVPGGSVRLNEISTSEIVERIKATAERLLGHHVDLSAILDHGRSGTACLVCGGRWEFVEAEGPSSGGDLDLILTEDGDSYCEEGATNYFDSNGKVTQRI